MFHRVIHRRPRYTVCKSLCKLVVSQGHPPQAKVLCLSKRLAVNTIPRFEQIQNQTQVISMNLSDNDLTTLPSSYFNNINTSFLKTLDLSRNALQELPTATRNLSQLESAHLQRNLITLSDNTQFQNIQGLRFLDLSYNKITELGPFVFKSLRSLRHLRLSHNDIRLIDSGSLTSLTYLDELLLDYNSITVLPDFLFKANIFMSLLNMKYNKITKIKRNSFNGLINLKQIDMNLNNINSIESESFATQRSLQRIKLSANRLSELPPQLFNATKCNYLALSHNRFYDTNNLFQALRGINNTLDKLTIGKNQLTSIPEDICKWFELRLFLIHDNPVKIQPNLSACSELWYLDLASTQIKTLSKCKFTNLGKLQLTWNHNPIYCDCNLQWLLKTDNVRGYTSLTPSKAPVECWNPRKLRGRQFMNLRVNDLECEDGQKPEKCSEGTSLGTIEKTVKVEMEASQITASQVTLSWIIHQVTPLTVYYFSLDLYPIDMVDKVGDVIRKQILAGITNHTFSGLTSHQAYNVCLSVTGENNRVVASTCIPFTTTQHTVESTLHTDVTTATAVNTDDKINASQENEKRVITALSIVIVLILLLSIALFFLWQRYRNKRAQAFHAMSFNNPSYPVENNEVPVDETLTLANRPIILSELLVADSDETETWVYVIS